MAEIRLDFGGRGKETVAAAGTCRAAVGEARREDDEAIAEMRGWVATGDELGDM